MPTHDAEHPDEPRSRARAYAALGVVLAYIVVAHSIDTLAAYVPAMHAFRWRMDNGADLFKLTAWLIIPLLYSLRTLDLGAFGVRRWSKIDIVILAVVALGGVVAMAVVHVTPSLRAVYPGWGHMPDAVRTQLAMHQLIWTLSWLTGWEFIHRYVLLRAADQAFPRRGWLLVPLVETLYHLQKPPLEALGMGVFGLILTAWARKRRNVALPFLAHSIIECELIAYLWGVG